ncbi:hypothetical protein MtrunA17_Chr1g0205161 [Medicago truncatula]|uniref:Transmembrane protein n=1 Tax=Medicago truncatula TaxID=3880 RepID=A0A396K1M6_MEDTR|nr:hypothetical protein MtrunA17_Chr1g0205161 [Medicago truncatula]
MSRGCRSCKFIRLGAFRMWLGVGVEVWEFYFEGCYLEVYLQGLCLVVMVYRLYAAPFVSCFVHTLRLARMAFNNIY